MKKIIAITFIVLFISCKRESTDSSPTNGEPVIIERGETFISFLLEGETIETGGELGVKINSLPTVLVASSKNRKNQEQTIGIGIRSIDLDTTQFPYTFKGAFGFSMPNADIFLQKKENNEYFLYSLESDGSGNDIYIETYAKDSLLIKGGFSGRFIKFKSDKDYLSRDYKGETELTKGDFKILLRK